VGIGRLENEEGIRRNVVHRLLVCDETHNDDDDDVFERERK
jgi:hypothetical protein